MTYSLLLDSFAQELKVKNGILSFYLAHPHVYKKHLPLINFDNWGIGDGSPHITKLKCPLLNWNLTNILKDKDGYMEDANFLWNSSSARTHSYNPKPEVFL